MEDNHLLSDNQQGFRSKWSCLSQLLSHYNEVISSLEQAFDTVDRFLLSQHMKKAGITEKAAVWLFRFLDGRTQQVITDKQISTPAPVKSGVPQGTVLGPQLFLLMINSLTEEDISSRIGIFADDTRVNL